MITLLILIGVVVGALIGRRAARFQARAEARHELAQARAAMRREVTHWQEAAARANAEAARIAREAEAFKDGCKHGREDVISIMPLLVAAQQRPADEARASGDER
jgi:predicted  nucleic acid-binding Zn-ribbon protein